MIVTRTSLLYGLLGAIGLLFAVDKGHQRFIHEPRSAAESRGDELANDIRETKLALARSRRAVKKLSELEQRSLPNDLELARSRYQIWLLKLVKQTEFVEPHVDSGEAIGRGGVKRFTFSVRGRGNLSQVVRFLHDFYAAGHLQRIRSMTINPIASTRDFNLSLAIDALSIPGAKTSAELSSLPSNRLASANRDDYRTIVRRDVFGVGGGNEVARLTSLTAITEDIRGHLQAWFSATGHDSSVKLRVGQELQIEPLQAEVVDIDGQNGVVVVKMEGQRWQLSIGQSLADVSLCQKR